jgi:hypothetical protein
MKWRAFSPLAESPKGDKSRKLRESASGREEHRHRETSVDLDLTAVIEAWDRLLEALSAGILAMVRAPRA